MTISVMQPASCLLLKDKKIFYNYSNSTLSSSPLTVSNLALSEYEHLHEKLEVEHCCRTKAEEFATNVSKQSIVRKNIPVGIVFQK